MQEKKDRAAGTAVSCLVNSCGASSTADPKCHIFVAATAMRTDERWGFKFLPRQWLAAAQIKSWMSARWAEQKAAAKKGEEATAAFLQKHTTAIVEAAAAREAAAAGGGSSSESGAGESGSESESSAVESGSESESG